LALRVDLLLHSAEVGCERLLFSELLLDSECGGASFFWAKCDGDEGFLALGEWLSADEDFLG
jgi:hypothetical protein